MKSKLIDDRQVKTYAVVFDPGDEVMAGLKTFAENNGITAAHITQPMIHVHCVVGKADGTTLGGHILEAHVWPTLEVIVNESPKHLQRIYDPNIDLALINLNA